MKDAFGNRMKEYEVVAESKLMRREPVIIRLDGAHAYTFTRGFKRPFDDVLMASMQETMEFLCKKIQNAVFGYTQSDEISIVLIDYRGLNTEQWFNGRVQKICSTASALATLEFNRVFKTKVEEYINTSKSFFITNDVEAQEKEDKYIHCLRKACEMGLTFDARCFNVPKEEVTNTIYWRQSNAARNSVQMLGRAHFSHKELQHKSCETIKQMLIEKSSYLNWDELASMYKWGTACYKRDNTWFIDSWMPLLLGKDREYLEKLIRTDEDK